MYILNVVNKTTKTSVPVQWASLFSKSNDRNQYEVVGLGWLMVRLIYRANVLHLHHVKSAFIVSILSIIFKKPVIYTMHGSPLLLSPLNKFLLFFTLFTADKLVVVNHSIIDELKTIPYLSRFSDEAVVINNGVDTAIKRVILPNVLQKYEISLEKNIVFHPARFVFEKNHEFIITALNQLKKNGFDDFLYVSAGDGPLREKVEEQVKALDLDSNVKFIGTITREEVLSLMSYSQLFLMPSVSEGLNVAFLEALVKRNNIIVSDIPSFRSFFSGNKINARDAGVSFVKPSDVEHMTSCILNTLSEPCAPEFNTDLIDIKNMAQSYHDAYYEIA